MEENQDLSGKDTGPKFSRRDFLKVAGALLGGRALERAEIRLFGSEGIPNRQALNVEDFIIEGVEKGEDEKPIVRLDFEKMAEEYPDIVQRENDGYVLRNKNEYPILFDLTGLGNKILKLDGHDTRVAKANIDPSEYGGEKGYGMSKAGLVFEGNFRVIAKRRWFMEELVVDASDLDRAIVFRGGDESVVGGIKLKGLKDYTQTTELSGDIPPPAYISADGVNLRVVGCKIIHEVADLGDKNEENAQLARGVVLQNTTDYIKSVFVEETTIEGLNWDGVGANGLSEVWVLNSKLKQSELYRDHRGAGVATTFNNPSLGKIVIQHSWIDYNKGVANFLVDGDWQDSKVENIYIDGSSIDVGQWATIINGNGPVVIRNSRVVFGEKTNQTLSEGGWESYPLGMVHVDNLNVPKKLSGKIAYRYDINRDLFADRPDDVFVLMRLIGGYQAIDNPEEYLEKVFDEDFNLAIIGLGRIIADLYFSNSGFKSVLKRAMDAGENYPSEMAIVCRKGVTGVDYGIVLDDISEGVERRKPTQVFWHQPGEELYGYKKM